MSGRGAAPFGGANDSECRGDRAGRPPVGEWNAAAGTGGPELGHNLARGTFLAGAGTGGRGPLGSHEDAWAMTVYGILSDIHGNLEALSAVLAAIDERGVDRLVCLGDIVGYNANSNECVEIVRGRGIDSVAGNHDLISIGRLGFDRCANRAFLAALEPHRLYEGRWLAIHGGLDDVQQYVRTTRQAQENAVVLQRRFPTVEACFYGHTHEPRIFEVREDEVRELPAAKVSWLQSGKLYFINSGSVDASRKREHKLAEFGVFDSNRLSVELHRVPYDHESVEEKSIRGGYRIGRVTELLYSLRRKISSMSK